MKSTFKKVLRETESKMKSTFTPFYISNACIKLIKNYIIIKLIKNYIIIIL